MNDTADWTPPVRAWEKHKSDHSIVSRQHERIRDTFLRDVLASQYGINSPDVTEDQIEIAALDLCRQYGRFLLIPPSVSEQVLDGDRTEVTRTVAGFWKRREDEFRKHDTNANKSLKAIWFSDDHWKFSNGSGVGSPPPGSENIVKSLAREAAKGLAGPLGPEPWIDWLKALRRARDSSTGKLLYSKISTTGSMILGARELERMLMAGEPIPPGGLVEFVLSENSVDGSHLPGATSAGAVEKRRFWDTTTEDIAGVFAASANYCLDLRSRAPATLDSGRGEPGQRRPSEVATPEQAADDAESDQLSQDQKAESGLSSDLTGKSKTA